FCMLLLLWNQVLKDAFQGSSGADDSRCVVPGIEGVDRRNKRALQRIWNVWREFRTWIEILCGWIHIYGSGIIIVSLGKFRVTHCPEMHRFVAPRTTARRSHCKTNFVVAW